MLLTPEKQTDLTTRLARLLADARTLDLPMTVATLEFAGFALAEDLRRHEPQS